MIKNLTTQKIVCDDEIRAESFLNKSLGFLTFPNDKGLIIKTRFGIHTFGLKYKIDVIILNREKKVVKLKENLEKNRIFLWNPRFHLVIELPHGSIKKSKSKLGDYFSFLL